VKAVSSLHINPARRAPSRFRRECRSTYFQQSQNKGHRASCKSYGFARRFFVKSNWLLG